MFAPLRLLGRQREGLALAARGLLGLFVDFLKAFLGFLELFGQKLVDRVSLKLDVMLEEVEPIVVEDAVVEFVHDELNSVTRQDVRVKFAVLRLLPLGLACCFFVPGQCDGERRTLSAQKLLILFVKYLLNFFFLGPLGILLEQLEPLQYLRLGPCLLADFY